MSTGNTGGNAISYGTTGAAITQNALPTASRSLSGKVYAIQAYGGFSTAQTFDNITRLPETIIQQYDTTGALEVLFDVRTFNALIGIYKNASNINLAVPVARFYDLSRCMLLQDSLTISASSFITGLNNDYTNVVSVGLFSSLYSDFAAYVHAYFGLTGSSLFTGVTFFDPNNGVFDASAFLNILVPYGPTTTGSSISSLSGSITVGGITQLLRNAVDANPFGNRDPSAGRTAADIYDRSNYGVTDGFLADDLIFIPNDGFQIQLGVSIADFAFGGGGTATAVRQDAAFTGGTTTTSTFSEVTTSTNTGITRINQAPLLIRLANLTQVDISAVSTSVDAYSITLNMKGTYDHVVIARNNMVVATNVTGTSYIDICLNSVTTYNYTITPYNSKNMPGTPYTLSATTISPIKKWVNIGPAGGINLTSSSGGRNVYTVYYDASYDTVWVGGSFVTSYQYLIYNTSGQGWNQGPPPPGGQSKWTDYFDSGVHVITKLNGHLFVGTSGCATNLMEIANNNSLISALNGSNPGNASCYSIAWNGQQLGTTPGANYYYVGSGNEMYNFVGNWDHHLSNNNIAGGSYVVCNTQTNTLYVHGNNCSYNCDVRNSDGWGHYYSPAVYNLNNYNQADKYFEPFPLNSWVHALYYDYNTNAVYAGGEFTYACPYNQSSGTYVKGVAMSVNNGPWQPMGKGLNSWTNSFAADPRTGIIYAGGQFTADGSGNPINHIAKYANGTWSQVGSGLNAPVYGLYFDTSCNFLYAAGNFTADGSGNAMYNIAKFDVT